MVERSSQRQRKTVAGGVDPGRWRGLRDECHRPRIRASQKIVKNQNGEEGISRNGKLQCGWSCEREADSIQPVEIEIHCDASVFDNHPLKRSGLPLALESFLCSSERLWRARIRRGKEQEQWKRETDKF